MLTFEDLPSGGPQFFLTDYHGFTFGTNDIDTTAWFYTDEASSLYVPSSPTHYIATDYRLYDNANPSEATQSIKSATSFLFNGAYFSGGDPVHYQLYLGGVLVYTSADSAVLTDTPIFVASGYAGQVDEVVVFGRQGYYALDDFTYNVTAAVPEPASYALAGIALLGAGAATARRRRGSAAQA